MFNFMKKRLIYLLKIITVFIISGILYGIFVGLTDLSIPCFFYERTGLYCPGCGISRMFINIFKLDFYGAFRSNVCVFIMLPVFFAYAVFKALGYIKYGKCTQTKFESVFIWIFAAVLILFGVLRNLSVFSYLAPI